MKTYTPRRAGKRWLVGAPSYVLDVFDNGGIAKRNGSVDRYTVMFTKPLLITDGTYGGTWVPYLGLSEEPSHYHGISGWGEMDAWQAADYRYRVKHQRIKWMDLPEHIRKHVIARAEED